MDLSEYFATPPTLPNGYPLPAVDSHGCALREGPRVRINPMPIALLHDLPEDEASRLRALEGVPLPILGFDACGYVWFGDEAPWFCVRPDEVTALADNDQRLRRLRRVAA